MNSPTETHYMSSADDDYAVDLSAPPLLPVDFQKTIAEHPMKAAMIAAAAGAGLMGLLTLAMRSPTPVERAERVADRLAERVTPDAATRSDLADLRDQLIGWAKDMIAAAPSRKEVRQGVADARQSVADARQSVMAASESVADTWSDVRDQATDLAQRVRTQVEDTAGRLRPKVNAAVDLAKDNPMWLGVAGAALAAVIAASAVSSARK